MDLLRPIEEYNRRIIYNITRLNCIVAEDNKYEEILYQLCVTINCI